MAAPTSDSPMSYLEITLLNESNEVLYKTRDILSPVPEVPAEKNTYPLIDLKMFIPSESLFFPRS